MMQSGIWTLESKRIVDSVSVDSRVPMSGSLFLRCFSSSSRDPWLDGNWLIGMLSYGVLVDALDSNSLVSIVSSLTSNSCKVSQLKNNLVLK